MLARGHPRHLERVDNNSYLLSLYVILCTASCHFRTLLQREHVQSEMPSDLLHHARGHGEADRQGKYSSATSVRVCELLYRQAASRRGYHSTQIALAWPKAHTGTVSHWTLVSQSGCAEIPYRA